MKKCLLPLAAAIATLPFPALAWGDKGHEIIAAIARDRLTPQARAFVDAILTTDNDTLTAPDMISRATWADKWRDSGHRETANWHFVDLELAAPKLETACFNFPKVPDPASAGPSQDCVIDKIDEIEEELSDAATAPAERLLALKYLLHFVGDVHQPLHSSDHEDRGGNCVHVALGDHRTTNLHSFWDTAVLTPLGDDPVTIAASLESSTSATDAKAWSSGQAKDWAEESFRAAKRSAYIIGSPSGCASDAAPIALTTVYQAQALKVARQQIEKAGVRLAWVLNSAAARASKPAR